MDLLSSEDSLRLNVLLANKPRALRVDESSMTVYGLMDQGEARVNLHANTRDEVYLRRVRELISGHVLGSPGGYPVYLKRWTRMGQARDESLEKLLLLGEPEAVVAVVHAAGLTDELARRAWWAMPVAENARRMLEREEVARGAMGPVLAEYLVEYLPFEEEPANMIESVRLALQPGLVTPALRDALWQKGKHKNALWVGFLWAVPDDLPEPVPAHPHLDRYRQPLSILARENRFAAQLLRVLDSSGQSFLRTAEQVLRKPANQDVMNLLLDGIARYFTPARPAGAKADTVERLLADAARWCDGEAVDGLPAPADLRAVLAAVPSLRREAASALVLARLGYPVVRPVFAHTTAIGTLMRKKLEPVVAPLLREIACLRGQEVQ